MLPRAITAIFVVGVCLLILALVCECVEMWIGLKTIAIETRGIVGGH